MSYFDSKEHVDQYIQMAEGYDGRELIEKLTTYLPAGASTLELGMGPGKDLELLAKHYSVTGTDTSRVFIDLYRASNPNADLFLLDAVSMKTNRTFQCIYSNKVLHHLTRDELRVSLSGQARVLEPGGIALHSFWQGDGEEVMEGMRFTYYQSTELENIAREAFEVLECSTYTEMESGDSLCLVMKKRG